MNELTSNEKRKKIKTPVTAKVIWAGSIEVLFFVYRIIFSPIFSTLGAQCRYEETCSSYARRVLVEKGAFKGIYLVLMRLWSCR
jgi:putative component of membrane protein insertase Oxa1/YidC/SpoIIIJ protein YidD